MDCEIILNMAKINPSKQAFLNIAKLSIYPDFFLQAGINIHT